MVSPISFLQQLSGIPELYAALHETDERRQNASLALATALPSFQ
jgi:hypothetical protein